MAAPATSDVTPTAKQLVFLFMAATVVAVVVFLCGVLVGRGVPVAEGRVAALGDDAGGDATEALEDLRPPILDSVSREPSAAASSGDDLTYYRRLGGDGAVGESVGVEGPEDSPEPEDPPASVASPPEAPAPQNDPREAEVPSPTDLATGSGFTVQVTALRQADAARQIADRLVARGFPAYVVEPGPDAPVAMYRVRVGRYPEKAEADRMLQRLEREEQFKPWITR